MGLYWGYGVMGLGEMLGLYNIGIVENEMETTI